MSQASGRLIRTIALRASNDALGDGAELRRRAFDDGYLYFSRLLAPESLHDLRTTVAEQCRQRGFFEPGARLGAYDDRRWIEFLCTITQSPEYTGLADADPVLSILRAVFGSEPRRTSGDLCRVVSPATPDLTTRPHQDVSYIRDSPGLWTVWMPLGDCPRELGPLCVLPRSHRNGLLPHQGGVDGLPGFDDVEWATGDLAVGDVLMFSGLTVHRALDNVTAGRLRLSVDYRYVPAAG
jgi:ectoine hydroxylase-related dioxygenase (phytanoyl-CoA dioxygenase family)